MMARTRTAPEAPSAALTVSPIACSASADGAACWVSADVPSPASARAGSDTGRHSGARPEPRCPADAKRPVRTSPARAVADYVENSSPPAARREPGRGVRDHLADRDPLMEPVANSSVVEGEVGARSSQPARQHRQRPALAPRSAGVARRRHVHHGGRRRAGHGDGRQMPDRARCARRDRHQPRRQRLPGSAHAVRDPRVGGVGAGAGDAAGDQADQPLGSRAGRVRGAAP